MGQGLSSVTGPQEYINPPQIMPATTSDPQTLFITSGLHGHGLLDFVVCFSETKIEVIGVIFFCLSASWQEFMSFLLRRGDTI